MGHKGNGLERLEADLLYYDQVVTNLSPIPGSDTIPEQLTIKRDPQLRVILEMSGSDNSLFAKERSRHVKAGTISTSGSMTGTIKHSDIKVDLIGISSMRRKSNFAGEYTILASAGTIRVTQSTSESKSAIIYAIGCPNLLFHRGTSRDVEAGKITLERLHVNENEVGFLKELSYKTYGESKSCATDYLLIKNKYGTVIFSKGETCPNTEKFAPCYLQFIDGLGVNSHDFRRKYLEAVSFALGKRLIEIGHSTFSEVHEPIVQSSRTPYSLNLEQEAGLHPLPPSERVLHGQFPSEESFCRIVECFLDNYELLDLSNVMWSVWTARLMPLGAELVSYSSALEALVKQWFKKKEPQKDMYIESSEFSLLVSPTRDLVAKSSINDELKETLNRKIDLVNQLSIGDKKRRFFESLKLGFGGIEKKTIGSRNKYAHGGSVKDEDVRYLIIFARCYETLINRALLGALNAAEQYVDYSSYDFPERELKTPMMGNNFEEATNK